MPTWSQLVKQLAEELGISPDSQSGKFSAGLLAGIPQYYENRYGRAALIGRLRNLVPRKPDKRSTVHDLLAKLPCTLFYTTNFDLLLEGALTAHDRDYVVVSDEDDARDHSGETNCQIRKIHGTWETAKSLVFTRSDYAQFGRLHPLLTDQLKMDLTTRTFLFVGYS